MLSRKSDVPLREAYDLLRESVHVHVMPDVIVLTLITLSTSRVRDVNLYDHAIDQLSITCWAKLVFWVLVRN